ncbi:MAG: DegT/DnrJ/EryC1/StrS family aminotransferase [Lentisphaerota bacterium]
MKVPLLDLKAQYDGIRSEMEPVLKEVVESQYFIMGPKVKACEEEIARYCRVPHAVGVTSGTDALLIALMTENIGDGDEVITTPYTFFATAGSIARVGAKPVFVDIDPVSFNINPALIEQKITPKTKAIMPVHLYGQMADMDAIMAIARKHKLVVIEDAAQAIGAEYKGRRAGSLGDYGCFSFFPSKNLGCFGDGGMVVTRNPKKAEKLAILRAHGSHPKYYHKIIGGNFRLDALQAAVVNVKLRHLDQWTGGRQANAARYDRLFTATDLVKKGSVQLPATVASRHIFNQYVIRVERRDALQAFLKEKEIGTEIYYPVPMHIQECFGYLGHKVGDFPESERAALGTLALPIYPELKDEQADYVVSSIRNFYGST